MTSADVDAVLTEAIELGSANLTYVWEDSTPEEQAMMAGLATAVHTGGSRATADQIREVWHRAGVWFPAGQAANAGRNLAAREVVVATDGTYSFAVDLQRLWLDKHRRLDWVKQELEEPARRWREELARKQDRSGEDKQPDQQRPVGSLRGALVLTGSCILVLIVIIVLSIANSHSTSPPTAENNPTPSPTFSFKDDFSNTQEGWSVTGQDASGRYSKGKYQIYLNKADASFALATASNLLNPPPSIAIKFSARQILGAATNFYYGVACMSDSTGDTDYEFQMQPGYVAILKYVNGGEPEILARGGSSAVPTNGENQIRVVCAISGSQNAAHLMLWVNGEKLCDVFDKTNPIESGETGLIVERVVGGKGVVAAEFENIVVTQI
jgi:hypothetical protein